MKFCPYCGGKVGDNERYCPNCGAVQNNSQNNQNTQGNGNQNTQPGNGYTQPGSGYTQPGAPLRPGVAPGYNPPYPQPVQQTPSIATASLICGILSFVCLGLIGSILAIVFAQSSKQQTGGVLCSSAKTGQTLGIVSLILSAIVIVAYIALVVILGISAGL